MLCSLGLLFVGFAACIALKDDDGREEVRYSYDDHVYYDSEEDYEKETFDYFMSLRIDEQETYFKENLDLRYYKDDLSKGLTDDKYLNAKHAQEISRITGKKFTNRYKTY